MSMDDGCTPSPQVLSAKNFCADNIALTKLAGFDNWPLYELMAKYAASERRYFKRELEKRDKGLETLRERIRELEASR